MKKLSVMIFGYLIFSLAIGSAASVMPARRPAIKLLAMAASPAPQTGTVPTGLPNGTPHSVTLTWTASAAVAGVTVAGYNVYRSATAGGEAGTPAINGATPIAGTTFTDTSAAPGQSYSYVIAAQSTVGNQSGFSNEASVTIPNNPSNPTGCKAAGQ